MWERDLWPVYRGIAKIMLAENEWIGRWLKLGKFLIDKKWLINSSSKPKIINLTTLSAVSYITRRSHEANSRDHGSAIMSNFELSL